MKPLKFNLELSEDNILGIYFALQDKIVSYEKCLADELKSDSPSREEIAFLGYEFNRTYSSLVAVEEFIQRNNILI